MYEAAEQPALLPSAISTITSQFNAHLGGIRIFDAGHANAPGFAEPSIATQARR
jgi:hypothetical protein